MIACSSSPTPAARRVLACAALAATALLNSAAPARAAAPPPGPRLAVVVGSSLGGPRDSPLRFARRDAGRFARLLNELAGVKRRELKLLLDRSASEVRRELKRALQRLSRLSRQGRHGVLFFYYSGHADDRAMLLGGTRLPWSELRGMLRSAAGGLRIGFIDACSSGSLTAPKGLSLGPPPAGARLDFKPTQGTAILAASGAGEVAQESSRLSGSFFTHHLIAGLRGAADRDRDGRVTLAEIRTYAGRLTRRSTAVGARVMQHPTYQLQISGHLEVRLTDLREGEARLELAQDLYGQLLVFERASGMVVLGTRKLLGSALSFTLPRGRYQVLVRRRGAVYLAEANLPWGGRYRLTRAGLRRRSYQEVLQKGTRLELRRHRLRVGGGVESGILDGMGPLARARLSYGAVIWGLELGLELGYGAASFDTVDTSVSTHALGGGLRVSYPLPWSVVDLVFGAQVGLNYWMQRVERAPDRESWVAELGLHAGLRVPLHRWLFAHGELRGAIHLPEVQAQGRQARPTVGLELGLGAIF